MREGLIVGIMATVLLLFTAACSSATAPAKTALPTTTSTTSPSYQPPRFIDFSQLSQVEAAAAQAGGRVTAGTTVTVDIPDTRSEFDARNALVYLPPAWFTSDAPRLPALILLPGEPGGPTDWTEDGNADGIANAVAHEHGGVAPIIVMPDPTGEEDADTECVNSTRFGNAETYLTVDVPTYLRATFRAATGPGSLGIAGASAGGTCATILGLRNPSVFETFASFSGYAVPTYQDDTVAESIPILFDGSEAAFAAHDPLTLLSEKDFPTSSAWFDAGTSDHESWANAKQLAAAGRQAGMKDVCLVGLPGSHTWTVWQQSLSAALPWLSAHLGLTSEPAAC